MADVARLVGMEVREYEKDGQKKHYRANRIYATTIL